MVAKDPDNDAVTWRFVGGPVGMSLDPAFGYLCWTPSTGQLGINSVTVKVQDSFGASSSQSFNIEVNSVNRPPQITSVPPTSAAVGNFISMPRTLRIQTATRWSGRLEIRRPMA